MQITIDFPPDIEQDLIRQASQFNMPVQTLILQAVRQAMQTSSHLASQWSEDVLSYEGTPDFPAFESYRSELLVPDEPQLF